MAEYERVAAATDIREGEISEFEVGGESICVARSDGTVYAFAAVCTHQECPLSTALLAGTELECECHGATFDLVSGAVTLPPATEALAVHPVREADGAIWVSIVAAAVPR